MGVSIKNDEEICGVSYEAISEPQISEVASTFTANDARFVVVPMTPPSDATPLQTMELMEHSGALDFWDHPDEDAYTQEDGEQI